ncbi:hypothetical protein EYF80_027011 [Liparis tanakae]|uniref:Uncharacterized protein n=1 Tax=Liparis tanakae TaxID=230148 RepID=A0A4Z2HBY4_9TELE|nr:hypothetical protein EYF80_027011 [Liparis tanakae]
MKEASCWHKYTFTYETVQSGSVGIPRETEVEVGGSNKAASREAHFVHPTSDHQSTSGGITRYGGGRRRINNATQSAGKKIPTARPAETGFTTDDGKHGG